MITIKQILENKFKIKDIANIIYDHLLQWKINDHISRNSKILQQIKLIEPSYIDVFSQKHNEKIKFNENFDYIQYFETKYLDIDYGVFIYEPPMYAGISILKCILNEYEADINNDNYKVIYKHLHNIYKKDLDMSIPEFDIYLNQCINGYVSKQQRFKCQNK